MYLNPNENKFLSYDAKDKHIQLPNQSLKSTYSVENVIFHLEI